MSPGKYTFGDSDQARARLRRLADLYETETRELLQHNGVRSPRVAVDLGCGPGWSTRLLKEVVDADRTIGLDTSERYITDARGNHHSSELEFQVHDIARAPFPIPAPDVLLCRFLLTHLSSPGEVLATWASVAAPGALLFIHETESLDTDDPTLRRYYELLAKLQRHYGQKLLIGSVLDACFENSGWRLVDSKRRILEKPAAKMAELHLANLRTWRHDEYARQSFDASEIDSIEASLAGIVNGSESGGIVLNAARQIIARRP
jgi:ubiquinone/menaquinone biosynthesis C-methylase UbiE